MEDALQAFSLAKHYCVRCVEDSLSAAPHFARFRDAGQHLVRVIHALPGLHGDTGLGAVNVYLGRAGATGEHVTHRWRRHADPTRKGHDFGLVLLTASTLDVLLWERWAIRALMLLEQRARMIVENVAADARGPEPASERSCVYLTWERVRQTTRVSPATRRDAAAVASELAGEVSSAEAEGAFEGVSRPRQERAAVGWHWSVVARRRDVLSGRHGG
jgi:hypothetical protein